MPKLVNLRDMAIIDLEEYARKFDLEHYVGTDNTQVNSIQIMKDLGIWSDAFCYDVRETMPYSYMVRVAEIMVSQDNPDEDVLESLCPDLRDNKQVVLAAVKKYGSSLRYASKRLRDDRDVVYAAVSKHGYALEYASKRLRDDRDIVWAAFKVGRGSLSFSSKRLLNDRNFMLDAVRIDKLCLVHASEEVQDLSLIHI